MEELSGIDGFYTRENPFGKFFNAYFVLNYGY